MTTPEYYSFSDEAVSSALEAARRPHEGRDLRAITEISTSVSPHRTLLAECISITVSNNQVCLNIPLGVGNICIAIPFNVPNGTVTQACLSICTIWGIPTGVCVSIDVGGAEIVKQCFGFC